MKHSCILFTDIGTVFVHSNTCPTIHHTKILQPSVMVCSYHSQFSSRDLSLQ